MSNPLYQQMNNQTGGTDFLQRFEQFKKTITGNPQQIIQEMLRSGRITQAQLDQAVKTANQYKGLLK